MSVCRVRGKERLQNVFQWNTRVDKTLLMNCIHFHRIYAFAHYILFVKKREKIRKQHILSFFLQLKLNLKD